MTSALPDPGLVFLQRAAARLVPVEAGEMDIEIAIIDLVEPLEQLVGPLLCDCSRDIVARWERNYPPVRNERPRFHPADATSHHRSDHVLRARARRAGAEGACKHRSVELL